MCVKKLSICQSFECNTVSGSVQGCGGSRSPNTIKYFFDTNYFELPLVLTVCKILTFKVISIAELPMSV